MEVLQQQLTVQIAEQQRQELRLVQPSVPDLKVEWLDLLRALHASGLPEPRSVTEKEHGILSVIYSGPPRGYLTEQAFLVLPHESGLCVYQWVLPDEEVEPGWLCIHKGAAAEVPEKIGNALGAGSNSRLR